jgi:6-pyruvoyltetrahydropterin/6-carboxytetrahydropterin synthase
LPNETLRNSPSPCPPPEGEGKERIPYTFTVLRLTRQVRFAVNTAFADDAPASPTNAYAAHPPLTGLGYYFALDVTLAGDQNPQSQYLRNIKDVDGVVRRAAIPIVTRAVRDSSFGGGARVLASLFEAMSGAWPGVSLTRLSLALSPFLSLHAHTEELPMTRLSQKFEFSATHRLHNPSLSDDANRATFGKCNNPLGHGHNYEVQVTVAAEPDAQGRVIDVPAMERTVAKHVIDKLDHKNLNAEVPEFSETIPSVENIAKTIYGMLRPHFPSPHKLAAVTVWETPKTWCEYEE